MQKLSANKINCYLIFIPEINLFPLSMKVVFFIDQSPIVEEPLQKIIQRFRLDGEGQNGKTVLCQQKDVMINLKLRWRRNDE